MIKSKEDYLYYLEQDRLALNIPYKRPRPFLDDVWRFQRLMRKREYLENCKSSVIWKPYKMLLKLIYQRKALKLGFTIPINVFEEGLSIAHYGTILVHVNAKIGKNCRLSECVNIGGTGGSTEAAVIGDNVFIGTGAKIMGPVHIGNDCVIGANTVMTKTIPGDGITIAGAPARKISDKDSTPFMQDLLKNQKNSYWRKKGWRPEHE